MGVNNFLDLLDKDEIFSKNEYSYYTSESRNLILRLLSQMNSSIDNYAHNSEFESLMNKFILQMFILNYEEANKIVKEALNLKKVALHFYIGTK
jgi:hypothetical protein